MRSSYAARFGVVGSVVALATVALAAVAYACTNLASLNLSDPGGVPGTQVTVTGSSFEPAASGATSPVVLHLNDVSGPVLATAVPDGAGNITTMFTVPEDVQPGYQVIVATQADPEGGGAAFGTPARATFQVISPEGGAAAEPPAAQNAGAAVTPSPSNVSPGLLALTIGLGAAGVLLFGAGATAFLRQARGREVPVPAKVRNE